MILLVKHCTLFKTLEVVTLLLFSEIYFFFFFSYLGNRGHVDIDVFSGDPLQYHYFMEIFKEVVEKRIEDLRGDSHEG